MSMTQKKPINVLSLFDGIAGCRQALHNLKIDCEYNASEIDKSAVKVAKNNFTDINHLGDVKLLSWRKEEKGEIDLLSAGLSMPRPLNIKYQKKKPFRR